MTAGLLAPPRPEVCSRICMLDRAVADEPGRADIGAGKLSHIAGLLEYVR
ncbi:MAG TPA: hypothetical protein VF299_02160 [Mycobacterium sp.]